MAIYESKYWRYSGIFDQRVATKIFDMGVNFGIQRAVRMAQEVARPHDDAFCDGRWGPKTEAAVNNHATIDMLQGLARLSENYYINLARKTPRLTKYLNGWLARARRFPQEM